MSLHNNWKFEDYPLDVYVNKNAGDKSVAYGAKIISWAGMVGHGETKDEALEKLRSRFNLYKENNIKLPNPGETVPLKFASNEKMSLYENFAIDFFDRILNANYYNGFYSDQTCLQYLEDFIESENKPEEIIKRIKEHYHYDITSIYNEPLWIVLKNISEWATSV